MIYLILSPAFKDKHNPDLGYEKLLKIGYTGEDSKKSRFDAYITENPTITTLYLIENGDEQDEINLHYHFKRFKTNYGREWFKYDQEIIDFFETHKTKESLGDLNTHISKSKKKKINELKSDVTVLSRVNQLVNQIFYLYYSDVSNIIEKQNIYRSTVNSLLLNYSDLQTYIRLNYPLVELDKIIDKVDDDVNEHLNKIYSFTYLPDKLRYLCSLDETIALSCLPHLPEIFVNYYTVLGPDRIKALRYKTSDMKKEYEGMIGNSKIDIKSLVLSSFTVGDKVPKSIIKNKLRDLYNSAGYSKTPKGTDLEEYFIVKSCKIQNSDGTRDNGYEILSIKS